jgi:Protein of unknown function (DUF721).
MPPTTYLKPDSDEAANIRSHAESARADAASDAGSAVAAKTQNAFLSSRAEAKRRQLDWMPRREASPFDPAPVFDAIARRLDINTSAAEALLKNEWILIVGADIARHAAPGAIENGMLTIFVASSVWLAELRQNHARDLLRLINERIGHGSVKRIDFRQESSVGGKRRAAPAYFKARKPQP